MFTETIAWDDFLHDERVSREVYSSVADRGQRIGLRRGEDNLRHPTLYSNLENEGEWVVRTTTTIVPKRSPGVSRWRSRATPNSQARAA